MAHVSFFSKYAQCVALFVLLSFWNCAQGAVIDSIVNTTYAKLTGVTREQVLALADHCTYTNVTYKRKIAIANESEIFRIPHSSIIVDDSPCGDIPQNATENELLLDNYMLLVPAKLLISNDVARANNIGSIYQALFIDKFRSHTKTAFESLVSLSGDVWVGYEEQSDRVCGGKVILPRQSFVIFSKTSVDKGIAFSFEINGVKGIATEVLSFNYEKNEDIHIALTEHLSSYNLKDSVCPARNGIDRSSGSSTDTNSAKGRKSSCFPARATVSINGNKAIPVSQISVGDAVLDVDGKYTDVFMFTHADDSSQSHWFVRLQTVQNESLTVSPGHFIYTADGLAKAESLYVGSFLLKADGTLAQVGKISFIEMPGLYNPQTVSGSLIVDGFAVSAYTDAILPQYAHAYLAPLRTLYRYFGMSRYVSHLLCGTSHLGADLQYLSRKVMSLFVPSMSAYVRYGIPSSYHRSVHLYSSKRIR